MVAHRFPELILFGVKPRFQSKVMKQDHKTLTHQTIQPVDAIHLQGHHR